MDDHGAKKQGTKVTRRYCACGCGVWWYTRFGDHRKYLDRFHYYRSRLVLPEKALCKHCGAEYTKPRKKGRPSEYCDEICKAFAKQLRNERNAFAKALRK